MKKYTKYLQADFPAAIVVFLVALPLCLGIALGSKAPLFSGIIAGVVGGIVIGLLSGSSLSVSGPAAGLIAIVASAILKLPSFETFLLAVVLAGFMQLLLGFAKAGILGDFVPNAVIKGMLAAIGIILILKQIPHLIGYDADFEGDETFIQPDNQNTFSELINAINIESWGPMIIGILSLLILVLFDSKTFKSNKVLKQVPGALIAVITGILLNLFFNTQHSTLVISPEHMVNLPIANNTDEFLKFFSFPDIKQISNPMVWRTALTIAIVASLETLLSLEAVDKMDPFKRVSPTNRELKAQGVGNMISGLLGGLPLTSVIVRSSANINAGAKSKMSAVLHGVLLLVAILLIPQTLNLIPLSALAAILIYTGYKLAKISLFTEFFEKGWNQFIPFVATIIAILFSDLLVGILLGIIVSLLFMVYSNFRSSITVVIDNNNYLFRLRKDVTFLNKPSLKTKLELLPENAYVLIDATQADFIDNDIIDVINEFKQHAGLKNIEVEIKKNNNKMQQFL
jgi:MFS superfamily sulfate permease-like transporter